METFLAAAALAILHVAARALTFLDRVPRSRWLSAAGGVSVAYVFLHLLPELQSAQEEVQEQATGLLAYLDDHVWIAALLGLTVFYGLERAAVAAPGVRQTAHEQGSRDDRRATDADRSHGEGEAGGEAPGQGPLFAASVASYAAYNAVVGYLLVQAFPAPRETVLFALAIGVHFVVNDHALRGRFRRNYDRWGRWLLGGAVLAGWLVGVALALPVEVVHLALAFLAGAIILNVMKEELPSERQSRFGPFAAGAASYGALLLAF